MKLVWGANVCRSRELALWGIVALGLPLILGPAASQEVAGSSATCGGPGR